MFACFTAAEPFLQCWHCSSDTIGAEDFCGTEFRESDIPDLLKERNISILRSCNSTINSEHERAVCRKTIEKSKYTITMTLIFEMKRIKTTSSPVNGKEVVKRFCYYTNKSDTVDHCIKEPTEKNVVRIYCEDCLTDKCNLASKYNISLSIFILSSLITFILATKANRV